MSGGRVYSPRRFRALARYVLSKFPEGLPVQTLWNLMWRCDTEAYLRLGRSITGASWLKVPDGVVPAKKSSKTTPDRRLRENRP